MCTLNVAAVAPLAGVTTEFGMTIDRPFGVVATRRGNTSFVSIAGVVEQRSNRTFVPSLIRVLILPDDMALSAGEALSPDDRYLLVAGGAGAVVIDVRAAQHGARNPVLGVLSSGLR